jgi:mannose-6-phosphate isomerase
MLYPYKFAPIPVERVWGGNRLARFGKPVPPAKRIGESWEISDRDDAQSVVANGPDKGRTLRELIETMGYEAIVGAPLRARPARESRSQGRSDNTHRFPLLVKLLDARQRLSLQVHPPPAVARKLKAEPKTEMWYALEADPGAHLIAGLRQGISGADFIRALEAAQSKIEDCVYRFPVTKGDVFFVPAGRLHAIDAGVVLVEIQQNSDTTYRVYDWGRVGLDGKPRELHVEHSLACINFSDIEPKKQKPNVEYRGVNGLWRLVECDYFCVHKLDLRNAWPDRCDGSSFHIICCVEGTVGILTADNKEDRLQVGEFTLLPAALGHYTLTPLAEPTNALKTFVPGHDR